MSLAEKIKTRITRCKRSVFLRSDFDDLAGYDQVGRCLRQLVKDEMLLKVGYGVYVRARKNRLTGNLMPDSPSGSDGVLLEVLDRLKVEYQFDKVTQNSLSGASTQIVANIKPIINGRFSRKLQIGKQSVNAI